MAGLRDVLIHDYQGVNPKRVWEVVEKELPALKGSLSKILPPLDKLKERMSEPE